MKNPGSNSLVVKVTLGAQIRRLTFPLKVEWSILLQQVCKAFRISSLDGFRVVYEDEERDFITISSTCDFEEALVCSGRSSLVACSLKLLIVADTDYYQKQQSIPGKYFRNLSVSNVDPLRPTRCRSLPCTRNLSHSDRLCSSYFHAHTLKTKFTIPKKTSVSEISSIFSSNQTMPSNSTSPIIIDRNLKNNNVSTKISDSISSKGNDNFEVKSNSSINSSLKEKANVHPENSKMRTSCAAIVSCSQQSTQTTSSMQSPMHSCSTQTTSKSHQDELNMSSQSLTNKECAIQTDPCVCYSSDSLQGLADDLGHFILTKLRHLNIEDLLARQTETIREEVSTESLAVKVVNDSNLEKMIHEKIDVPKEGERECNNLQTSMMNSFFDTFSSLGPSSQHLSTSISELSEKIDAITKKFEAASDNFIISSRKSAETDDFKATDRSSSSENNDDSSSKTCLDSASASRSTDEGTKRSARSRCDGKKGSNKKDCSQRRNSSDSDDCSGDHTSAAAHSPSSVTESLSSARLSDTSSTFSKVRESTDITTDSNSTQRSLPDCESIRQEGSAKSESLTSNARNEKDNVSEISQSQKSTNSQQQRHKNDADNDSDSEESDTEVDHRFPPGPASSSDDVVASTLSRVDSSLSRMHFSDDNDCYDRIPNDDGNNATSSSEQELNTLEPNNDRMNVSLESALDDSPNCKSDIRQSMPNGDSGRQTLPTIPSVDSSAIVGEMFQSTDDISRLMDSSTSQMGYIDEKLMKIEEKGFENLAFNRVVLAMHNGDVDAALKELQEFYKSS